MAARDTHNDDNDPSSDDIAAASLIECSKRPLVGHPLVGHSIFVRPEHYKFPKFDGPVLVRGKLPTDLSIMPEGGQGSTFSREGPM